MQTIWIADAYCGDEKRFVVPTGTGNSDFGRTNGHANFASFVNLLEKTPAGEERRALDKAALAYRQAGKTEEADRLSRELHERYPNYAGG